tara:strand:- start:5660 stop:7003 length:1344 start_codon:yes stop_codon:yes gene_type:complete
LAEASVASSEAPYPKPAYAWLVVVVLIFAALIAFIDRQVVAIVVDPMKEDLGVGDAQIGWLYGVFAVFYAVAGLPIAWMADRKSRKHIIAAGIFLWSFMTMACGLTRNFWQILLARIGVGVGEATLSPATTSLIGDYFPREKIPLALTVFQIGPVVGSGIAFVIGGLVLSIVENTEPLVLPWFGELRPWQQTFVYLGLPGVVLAFLFLLIREPVRRMLPGSSGASPSNRETIEFYRDNFKTLALHHFGFLSLNLMGYAFVFWTVSYFVRVHGYEAATASQIFGWIFLLAGPVGPILITLLARRLNDKGHADGNITAGMIGGLFAFVFILMIQFVPSAAWAFALYVPAMAAVNSPFGIAAGALPVITPPHMRAQIAAIYMLVGALGMMIGPPLAGAFNEYLFPGPEGVRYSLITLTCMFGSIAAACLWFCRRHYAVSMAQADERFADA